MASFPEIRFSKITTDLATSFVVLLFVDEIILRFCNFNSHRLYLNAVLRSGSGVSLALLFLLSFCQLAACAVITLPVLYNQLGTAAPSVALGATLVFEMLVYHGFSDNELIIKAVMIELSLFLIGLLRGDARIRADALGTPLHGSAIAAEAKLREVCTRIHAALVFPPLCVLLLLRSIIYYRYWAFTGTSFEIKRTSFCTSVALCSLLLFAAGQDRSPSQQVSHKALTYAYECYRMVYRLIHGHAPNGRKKEI